LTGIAYCQLIDSLAPGVVPLQKLCFGARVLDDNVKNLRILEEAMFKLGIRKDLDVAGIAKGKFQVGCSVAKFSKEMPRESGAVGIFQAGCSGITNSSNKSFFPREFQRIVRNFDHLRRWCMLQRTNR
jgi:hypothetical protein